MWWIFDKWKFRSHSRTLLSRVILTQMITNWFHTSVFLTLAFSLETINQLGEQNLESSDDGAEPKEYNIQTIMKHENYNRIKKLNDIALLELEENVKFTKFIHPACLQLKHYKNKVIVVSTKYKFFLKNADYWLTL